MFRDDKSCHFCGGQNKMFVFAERLRVCEQCKADSAKITKAVRLSNIFIAIEIERKRKLSFMHEYYFASLSIQNSQRGFKLLDGIVECRIRIASLENKLQEV